MPVITASATTTIVIVQNIKCFTNFAIFSPPCSFALSLYHLARPYNNLDRHFVHVEKDAIETALQKLAQNLMEVGTFTKTTVEQNRRNPDILRSAQDIFTRSLVIATGLTELETRANTYLELYTKHP